MSELLRNVFFQPMLFLFSSFQEGPVRVAAFSRSMTFVLSHKPVRTHFQALSVYRTSFPTQQKAPIDELPFIELHFAFFFLNFLSTIYHFL